MVQVLALQLEVIDLERHGERPGISEASTCTTSNTASTHTCSNPHVVALANVLLLPGLLVCDRHSRLFGTERICCGGAIFHFPHGTGHYLPWRPFKAIT